MMKRVLSIILALTMVLSFLPGTARAAAEVEPTKLTDKDATNGVITLDKANTPYEVETGVKIKVPIEITAAGVTLIVNGTITPDTQDEDDQPEKVAITNKGASTILKGIGTISRSADAYVIENRGTLTINSNIAISSDSATSTTVFPCVYNLGTLTINGGTIESTSSSSTAVKNGDNGKTGTLTVSGGTIMGGTHGVENWGRATIEGGKLTGTTAGVSAWANAADKASLRAETTITGTADITGDVRSYRYNVGEVFPEIEITGGTIHGNLHIYDQTGDVFDEPNPAPKKTDVFHITGGMFYDQNVSDYLDESLYEAFSKTNAAPWTVVPKGDDADPKLDHVAKVLTGGTPAEKFYKTFADALQAANAGVGNTVTLLKTTTEEVTCRVTTDLTIDLAGNTVILATGSIIVSGSGVKLDITGKGSITGRGDRTITVQEGATLEITNKDTIIENTSSQESGGTAVAVESDSTLTITEGTVRAMGAKGIGVSVGSKGILKVVAGTVRTAGTGGVGVSADSCDEINITGTIRAEGKDSVGVSVDKNSYLTVLGLGTIQADETGSIAILHRSDSENTSPDRRTIVIAGGTISAKNGCAIYNQTGDITISGGTITGQIGIVSHAGRIDITGDTESTKITATSKEKTVSVPGYSVPLPPAAVVLAETDNSEGAQIYIKGGKVSAAEKQNAVAYTDKSGNLKKSATWDDDDTSLPRIEITGGTFTTDVRYYLDASGTKADTNNETKFVPETHTVWIPEGSTGVYIVEEIKDPGHEADIAQVIPGPSGKAEGYPSLKEAVEAAKDGDRVIVVAADKVISEEDAPIPVTTEITIDLKDHTVDFSGVTGSDTAGFIIKNNVTIQNGTIYADDPKPVIRIEEIEDIDDTLEDTAPSVELNKVHIVPKPAEDSTGDPVPASTTGIELKSGKLTITDGEIACTTGIDAKGSTGAQITISGSSTFNCGTDGTAIDAGKDITTDTSTKNPTITISGTGKFTCGTVIDVTGSTYATQNGPGAVISINGGEFNCTTVIKAGGEADDGATNAKITIGRGTFNCETAIAAANSTQTEITIDGGNTFNCTTGPIINMEEVESGKLTISRGYFECTDGAGIIMTGTGSMDIKGGTFKTATTTIDVGLSRAPTDTDTAAAVTISGDTFESAEGPVINIRSGSVDIKGGSFTAVTKSADGTEDKGTGIAIKTGTLTIEDGTFECQNAIDATEFETDASEGDKIEIFGGTFHSQDHTFTDINPDTNEPSSGYDSRITIYGGYFTIPKEGSEKDRAADLSLKEVKDDKDADDDQKNGYLDKGLTLEETNKNEIGKVVPKPGVRKITFYLNDDTSEPEATLLDELRTAKDGILSETNRDALAEKIEEIIAKWKAEKGKNYEFLGWFRDPVAGGEKDAIDLEKTKFTADTKLYAHWQQLPPYTITFELNYEDTTPSPYYSQDTPNGDSQLYDWPEHPTRTGYAFLGWFIEKEGGTPVYDPEVEDTSYKFSKDTTLYAQWKPLAPYTITFDADGGKFENGDETLVMKTDSDGLYLVDEDGKITWPEDPEREDHEFLGWFTEKDGKGEKFEKDTAKFTDNITLYAHWKSLVFEITFDLNYDGAVNTPKPRETDGKGVLAGTGETGWPLDPRREGYTFLGWFTKDGVRVYDPEAMDHTYTFTEDTLLYAQWAPPSATITLHAEKGKFADGKDTATVKAENGKISTWPDDPTREGYTFDGWYTEAEGGAKVEKTSPVAVTDLYAHWTRDEHTITFDLNYTGSPANTTAKTGSDGKVAAADWPEDPTREGYTFGGWYDDATDGKKVDTSTEFNKDTTLYAHWIKSGKRTITFDANGGTFADGEKTTEVETDEKGALSKLPDAPTREGYTFEGWYTKADGGDTVAAGAVFDDDATVYAHWTAKEKQPTHTITFDPNGGIMTGSKTMTTGTYGTLSRMPDDPTRDGYVFAGWYTAATGGTRVTTDTVFTEDATVYAHWTGRTSGDYYIRLYASPVRGGSVTGGGYYDSGESVTAQAVPASGYRFVCWTENGVLVSNSSTYTFAAAANRTLTAQFEPANSSVGGSSGSVGAPGDAANRVIVPTVSNGTLTVAPRSAKPGDTVTITAIPYSGYTARVNVTDRSGRSISVRDNGDDTYTFAMPASQVSIDVTFHGISGAPGSAPVPPTSASDRLPGTPSGASGATSFIDVPASDYCAPAVAWAVRRGITTGTGNGTFSPNASCTRGQILTFIWRAEGSPEPVGANPFSDIKASDYYYKAAIWAYESGMVSTRTFGANTPCTRSEAVTYLWQLAWQISGSPATAASTTAFTDVPTFGYASRAIPWAVERGITTGTSATTFSPDAICTRGQIMTFLYRFDMF